MLLDRLKLTDKVAIVTGAGRGIGRGTALALAEMGAHVVCAALTDALAPFLSDEARTRMEELTPMKRLGEVEDIALVALYLASPASSWVTGKVFEIDGGTENTNWPIEV